MISVELATETIRSTDLHPFWVVEGEDLDSRPKPGHVSDEEWEQLPDTGMWVNARDLREGDVLLKQDGTTERVLSVRAQWVSEQVYNFEVVDSHNYAVGNQRVLVHNAEYGVHWTSAEVWESVTDGAILRPSRNGLLWWEQADSLGQVCNILRQYGTNTSAHSTDVALIVNARGMIFEAGGGGVRSLLPNGLQLAGPGGRGLTWFWSRR